MFAGICIADYLGRRLDNSETKEFCGFGEEVGGGKGEGGGRGGAGVMTRRVLQKRCEACLQGPDAQASNVETTAVLRSDLWCFPLQFGHAAALCCRSILERRSCWLCDVATMPWSVKFRNGCQHLCWQHVPMSLQQTALLDCQSYPLPYPTSAVLELWRFSLRKPSWANST